MNKCLAIVVCLTLFILTSIVDSYAEITADELLHVLLEKGIITAQDIEKARESMPAKAAEKAAPEKEAVVKAARQPKSIQFKGRVQARYTSLQNGNLNNVTSQNAFDQSDFDGFVIRRARLQWFGEVVDRWKYKIQVSADGDHNADNLDPATPDYNLRKDEVGLKLQDAYFTYNRHPYLNVTVGQFKSRFSPSYLTSGPVLPLCERPLAVDKLSRKREIGLSIESATPGQFDGRGHETKVYDKPIYYALGLYNGNGFNKQRNDNDNLMVTAMLLARPSRYINFGVSYAYDHIGYDSETTALGTATLVDIGGTSYYVYSVKNGTVGKRMNIWDFNCAIDIDPVHVQAEYIQQTGHGFNRAYGYGVQGQVDLTDTFQLAARYDEFDPNVKVDNTFDSRWYTVGCNWFLRKQDIKWQLNYTFREEMHGEDIDNDALVTHFQVLF